MFTQKKLILDTCIKTPYPLKNTIYKQNDCVSMGSSLGPVMVNIIMTKLENKIIKTLMNGDTIKFYCWYFDDTLLVKPQDVSRIHKLLNGFDKIYKFLLICLKMKFPIFLA